MTFQTRIDAFSDQAQVIAFPRRRTNEDERGRVAEAPIRRPPTLISAAKWRAARYRRGRDLPKLASGLSVLPKGAPALLARLEEIEAQCWRALKENAGRYTPERHVLALAALLAERAAGHRRRR